MQTQHCQRPEGTLAYSDYGGELVLLLPGMGALRSEYRYLAPKLSEAATAQGLSICVGVKLLRY